MKLEIEKGDVVLFVQEKSRDYMIGSVVTVFKHAVKVKDLTGVEHVMYKRCCEVVKKHEIVEKGNKV